MKIFVTPNQYFKAKFRGIFTRTKIQHSSGAESKRWLAGPNMRYWPQRLNFAIWCATTGCGITREVLDKVSEQIKSFLMFHFYFTVRRILFEMGGIQSESALPGEPAFSQINNNYDTPLFKRICAEFGISPSADIRFKSGDNHDLGSVFIYVTNAGPMAISISYPVNNKFSDGCGKAIKGNLISFIRSDYANWLTGNSTSSWQTSQKVSRKLGWRDWISRLRHSFTAFLVQKSMSDHQSWVNQEALRNSKPRVSSWYWLRMRSESQTFRRAIDESKVKLHLAVSPDTWLMPSNLLLNTQSTVGYNKSLKKTNKDIELGVKKSMNLEMKPVGVRHTNGGSSKIKRLTSQPSARPRIHHPSNKINKTATEVQAKTPPRLDERLSLSDSETNHDIVKVGLISAGLVSAFMVHRLFFWKRSTINMATSIIRMIAGGLIPKYIRYTAIASAPLLTFKNVEVPLINDKEKDNTCEETE